MEPRTAEPEAVPLPHAAEADAVANSLGSDLARGLDPDRVAERLERWGPNELQAEPPPPAWRRFLAHFNELVVWILLAAALIAFALREWTDGLAILAIVLLNAVIGFLQESRAERSLAALRGLSAPSAKVVRGGELQTVPARELVPGDRVLIEAGDNVPADLRLLEASRLQVQEAALTGESLPVEKDPQAVLGAQTPIGDRLNMVYLGTVAAAGKGAGVVTATGMQTELGRIAGLLAREEPQPTPLQRRLAELGRVLIAVCLVLVAAIFAVSLLRGGRLLEVFLVSVSLAVAAVPEGLPAVVTLALALGLQRMVKRQALVRKLPSVETLGSVTVICSDKTGTLTRNEMTVRRIVAGGESYAVTGAGYAPRGGFFRVRSGLAAPSTTEPRAGAPEAKEQVDLREAPDLFQALLVGARCNNATVRPSGKDAAGWQVIGDPTEGALIVAALKARIEPAEDPILLEIPFDSERKAMSVVLRRPGGGTVMYTKGAPEVIVAKCAWELRGGEITPFTPERRGEALRTSAELASRALRVLGLAYREDPQSPAAGFEESSLVFAGLVGMMDPPREEVKEAVRKCRDAGVRPVMITGDHPQTALAIARELGIAGAGERALTGAELETMTGEDLQREAPAVSVYARVSAEHKLRIVEAWKRRGDVVAMTGDGVNDAPAVKAADIGIAMGITGTDVTREASDMVLLDDNFASIVNAVEEGRGIYDNIQKVLQYLLSCNLGEILLMLCASLLGWPAPLIPVQLLWVNLVTDGFPALALSMERPEPGIMSRPPRPPGETMLSLRTGLWILLQGVLVGGAALAAYAVLYLDQPEAPGRARTAAFCVLAYGELFRAFAARSGRLTLFQLGPFSNRPLLGAVAVSALIQYSIVSMPFARPFFETVQHLAGDWLLVLGLSLIPVTVIEVVKLARERLGRTRRPFQG